MVDEWSLDQPLIRWFTTAVDGYCAAAASRFRRDEAVARLDAESSTFRRRDDFGVTSTHSSFRMNSSACSSESGRGGISRISSSAEAARMLVSFFGFDA